MSVTSAKPFVGHTFAPSTWEVLQNHSWLCPLDLRFERFIRRLKSRTISSSTQWATKTLNLIKSYLDVAPAETTASEIITLLTYFGRILSEARPIELVIGNVIRRVLYFVRQECAIFSKSGSRSSAGGMDSIDLSLSLMRVLDTKKDTSLSTLLCDIKKNLDTSIAELFNELEGADSSVSEESRNHIYTNESLLTFGYSRLVLAFLKQAHSLNRKIEVFVSEAGTSMSGQRMAGALAAAGIKATLVSDASVFALMPSISKVVLGTHAVLADGGLIAHSGGFGVCVAAKTNAVPVVVLTGLHKLSPQYAFNHDTFNEQLPPSDLLKFDQAMEGRVDVINPGFDFVPPEYVSLFVTNFGTYQPSYLYRLLSEYYSLVDHNLKSVQ